MKIYLCRECGVELNDNNINLSYIKNYNYICKECTKKYNKSYRKDNRNTILTKQKEYWDSNKEKLNDKRKVYRSNNIDIFRQNSKQYYQSNKNILPCFSKEAKEAIKIMRTEYLHTPKGKISIRRCRDTRRNLGYIPLNNCFNGSDGHHINNNDVIFIPEETHNIPHSLVNGKNMEILNTIAFFFLVMQNIDTLKKIFKN